MSRTRRGVLLVAGLAPPVAALFLYFQYIRIPRGYADPMTLPRSLVEERARSFRRKAHELTSRILSGEAFQVTFTEEEVNAYIAQTLAATGRAWYERFGLPVELEGVQLQFRPGTVTLLARWERGGPACILGMRLDLALRLGDGRRVRLREMNLGEGTLHLAGGPGPAGRR